MARSRLLSRGLLLLLLLASPIEAYATDADGDGVEAGDDCDDSNPAVSPSAAEICDPADVDEDCDGLADDADPDVALDSQLLWYTDVDGDGFGLGEAQLACATLGALRSGDCDDNNAAVYPGAEEADCADPTDYNCDGSVGAADADGDAWPACADCDDRTAAVSPSAAEICDVDNLDEDCDRLADDEDPNLDLSTVLAWYADADGDGSAGTASFGCDLPDGASSTRDDCDDAAPDVFPGAIEVACDDVDDDCSGSDLVIAVYADTDGDGHGDPLRASPCDLVDEGWVPLSDDCDDSNLDVFPGAPERGCDGLDSDCDGFDGVQLFYQDADGDGHGDPAVSADCDTVDAGWVELGDDCDDTRPEISPSAAEIPCGEDDEDCDGEIDHSGEFEIFADADGDTYGNTSQSALHCNGTPVAEGWATRDGDCDDADPERFPDNYDGCDGLNNDCDTYYDEDAAWVDYYLDQDQDGWGSGYFYSACSEEGLEAWATVGGDCVDADPEINPDAEEVCDQIDNDCTNGVDRASDGCGGTYSVCDDDDDCGGSGGFCCSGGSMLLLGALLRRRSRSPNT